MGNNGRMIAIAISVFWVVFAFYLAATLDWMAPPPPPA